MASGQATTPVAPLAAPNGGSEPCERTIQRRCACPISHPATVRKVALASVIAYALLVVSGGAVRLTGSGLGCPDWPSCYQHHLTAVSSFHPLVEFANRLVSAAVTRALGRRPRRDGPPPPPRRDLTVARCGARRRHRGPDRARRPGRALQAQPLPRRPPLRADDRDPRRRDRALPPVGQRSNTRPSPWSGETSSVWRGCSCALSTVVTLLGTVVTGAGPHAGGAGAESGSRSRSGTSPRLHSSVALFLIGLTLASQFAFHYAKAPPVVLRRGRLFIEVMAVQGALGYLQYFLHDAAWVVEFHLAGVTTLWISGNRFLPVLAPPPAPATGVAPATAAGGRRSSVGN